MKLNDMICRNAKSPPPLPSGKASMRMMSDGQGLRLEVWSHHGRYWAIKVKGKLFRLGVYPALSLADARIKANEYRTTIGAGKNPKAKRAAKAAKGSTFEDVARRWHANHADAWTDTYSNNVMQQIKDNLFDYPVNPTTLGKLALSAISSSMMLELLRGIESHSVRVKVKEYAARIFETGVDEGLISNAPMTKGSFRESLPKGRAAKQQPHVSEAEMPALLRTIEAYQARPVMRLALNLCTLTLLRANELVGARWSEFGTMGSNGQTLSVWTVPAKNADGSNRMKFGKREHRIPLSRQALAVVAELRALNGGEYLFPQTDDATKHINRNELRDTLAVMGYGGRQSPHGFRHQFKTIMENDGADPTHVEHCLAHRTPGMAGKYGNPTYVVQRATILQRWATILDTLRATR